MRGARSGMHLKHTFLFFYFQYPKTLESQFISFTMLRRNTAFCVEERVYEKKHVLAIALSGGQFHFMLAYLKSLLLYHLLFSYEKSIQ